jgi:hypothetical protein
MRGVDYFLRTAMRSLGLSFGYESPVELLEAPDDPVMDNSRGSSSQYDPRASYVPVKARATRDGPVIPRNRRRQRRGF